MEQKNERKFLTKESERVIVKMTDGTLFEGEVSLHQRSRVVDSLNHDEPFFNLRHVKINEKEDADLVVLRKSQVIWVRYVNTPADEISGTMVMRKGDKAKSNVFKK